VTLEVMLQEGLTADGVTGWILPAALAAGGLVVGRVVEVVLLRRLRDVAERTTWSWDDLVIGSFRGTIVVLFGAAGLYGALISIDLAPDLTGMIRTVLKVAVILALTVSASRFTGGAIRLWMRRAEGKVPSSSLIENVARILVVAAGLLLVVQNLGYEVSALLTGLGIGGLAVALALQDTLSNLFAGFQIILARQVRQGDYVQLEGGEEGYVTDIQWRNTTIESRVEDHEVIVPNSKLAGAIVTNFNRPRGLFWVRIEAGVAYDSDLERVEEVTLEVARQVQEEFDVQHLSEPVFRYREFGDSSVNLVVRMRVDEYAKQFRVRHAFLKRLHARYAAEGIEIPFPIRTLYAPRGLQVRDGRGAGGETAGAPPGREAS